MSVTVRPYRRGGWEVDIQWRSPNGRRRRERKRVSVTSKAAALRWGEARQRELLVHGPAPATEGSAKPRDVLAAVPRRLSAGEPAQAQWHRREGHGGRIHLLPALGTRRLDAISTEDVQRLKAKLRTKSTKTVNNILTVLNVVLKKAVEWNVIERTQA